MKVIQFNKNFIVTGVLCLLAWLYLLFPTSAPLALNGLPLDHKTEFLVFIALSLTILVALVLRYLVRIGFVPPPDRARLAPRFRAYLEIVAIFLLLTLFVFKLFYRESNQLTSCFEIPGVNDDRCVWLPEGFRVHQSDQVSRFEESITFAAPDRPWRLASFNDARVFNWYDMPEGTPHRRIQDLRPNRAHERRILTLRKSRSYPFSATFRLGEPIARLLRQEYAQNEKISLAVKYTGVVGVSGIADGPVAFPYSETEQSQLLDVPVSSIPDLVIRYSNFRCADESQATSQCARSLAVTSLSLEAARLDVTVIHPGDGKRIPLGYAPLLANGRGRAILMAFGFLEGLAGAIAVLVLLIRIYPYFSSARENAKEFVRNARGQLPVVFQIILVGTLSAVVIRALYRYLFRLGVLANGENLTILVSLGAAYVGLFCLVLFSKRVQQFFVAAISFLGPGAAIVTLAPFLLFIGLTLCLRVPPMNEVNFLNPGDDALTYASDGMGILEAGAPRTSTLAFLHFLIKPLFLHFRALYYGIFGGGEAYYSVLITTAFVCVWSMALVFLLLAGSSGVNLTAVSSWTLRIAIAAACAIAYVTLSKTFLVYGASFAAKAFSEGPAWLFGVGSFALLITLTNSNRPALTLWLIGALFAASLCFRTQYVMFLPFLVSLCAFLRRDLSWKTLLVCLCLPTLSLGAFFLLYCLSDPPTTRQTDFLLSVATPFVHAFSAETILRQAKFLFPSYLEFLSAVSVLSLLVWVWVAKGATKRLVILCSACAATVFIFDGMVAGNAGYYPRHIIMAFFLTSCATLALIQNLFVTHKASNAVDGAIVS